MICGQVEIGNVSLGRRAAKRLITYGGVTTKVTPFLLSNSQPRMLNRIELIYADLLTCQDRMNFKTSKRVKS